VRAERLLLLDAGGVLVSTGPMTASVGVVAQRTGRPFDDCWEHWQRLRPDFWRGRLGHEDLWREMGVADGGDECELAARGAVTLLPHAQEIAGLPVRTWVLSNHRTAWVMPVLEPLVRDGHIERVLVSDEIGAYKPEPRAFEIPLELSGVPAPDVLFVDDKQRNLDAAAAVGMQTLLADADGAWLPAARAFAVA
jgi:putative hydrolase of the HAD superfamily